MAEWSGSGVEAGGIGDSGSGSFCREWDWLRPELRWDPHCKEHGFPLVAGGAHTSGDDDSDGTSPIF